MKTRFIKRRQKVFFTLCQELGGNERGSSRENEWKGVFAPLDL